ncbi:MAG: styrene monooxygenase/indole monooxygenase family protein [Prochloraceae cyanobacterium]
MKKIAIIGAGQAGLYLGISLVDAGYSVTIYADRTPEEVLNSKLPATATIFPEAIELEKKLGLNFWDEDFNGTEKYLNKICDCQGNINLNISATLEKPWKAIDLRLKSSIQMAEFSRRGGKLIFQTISLEDLEECNKNYDLVIVSVGKGSLAKIFPRDEQKSQHIQPQRHVAAMLTELDPTYSNTFEVINLAGLGEIIQFPFYSKDKKIVRAVVVEAYPNSPIDLFSQAKSAPELLKIIKQIIQQFAPWNYQYIQNTKAIDNKTWLWGAITPKVRKPVGHLKSGGIVMGIGDVVILNDPIAAQGANNAIKMADLVAKRIIARGDRPFNEFWMQKVFAEFWEYSQYVNLLSNFLLTPGDSIKIISAAMAENSQLTRAVLNGFDRPPSLYPWYFYPEAAQKYLDRQKVAVSC